MASKVHGGKANLVKFAKVLDLDVRDELLRKRKSNIVHPTASASASSPSELHCNNSCIGQVIPPLDSKGDIALELFGVTIGTYGDFWDCDEHALRPKLVLRCHDRSLQLVLRIMKHDTVSVFIPLREVRRLFIAENSALFNLQQLKIKPSTLSALEEIEPEMTPLIQVLFLQTDAQLAAHSWLASYYDPHCAEMPGKQRIALFVSAKDYAKLKHALLAEAPPWHMADAVQHIEYVHHMHMTCILCH